jgi:anti-anti-sigma regulatory factor
LLLKNPNQLIKVLNEPNSDDLSALLEARGTELLDSLGADLLVAMLAKLNSVGLNFVLEAEETCF